MPQSQADLLSAQYLEARDFSDLVASPGFARLKDHLKKEMEAATLTMLSPRNRPAAQNERDAVSVLAGKFQLIRLAEITAEKKDRLAASLKALGVEV